MQQLTKWLLISCSIALLTSCSSGLQKPISKTNNIAISGYSPVSYFEKNIAELGNASHSYEYDKQVYYFASEEQIELFKQNPTKYLPRYGRFCPYSLAQGRRVAIDPTNFKIHDGQLLLFHNRVELNALDPLTQENIFKKADHQFKLLSF